MLTLLHGFRLESHGRDVDLPLGSQRLVAFLAVHRRPLNRPYVAGNLWAEHGDDQANASLRTTLWRLRRLAVPLVVATRSRLELSPAVHVDLHTSDGHARRVLRHQQAEGEPLDALLHHGDLLSDWYDDWVLLERERFRQLRLHALEALCDDLAAQGSFARAVEAGGACVAAEPLRESAHRTLMRAHCAEGNPGEAIRQYRLYRQLVADQLGLQPSPAMEQLVAPLLGRSA